MESIFSGILAILMSFLTMVSGLFNLPANPGSTQPNGKDGVGFEEQVEGTIRIMSFNIRCTNVGKMEWDDRLPLVTATILNGHPDSIGVQEATTEWMEALNETLGEEYASVGVGRDDGVHAGEHTAIFYLKDKYTVVDSGNFWLSETPDVPSKSWNAGDNRVCTWIVLQNNETGEKYVHINSHFDNKSAEARAHSVDMILDKAAEFDDMPVVFTADMNIEEGSVDYKNITENGTLRDAKYATSDTMDYLTYHDTKPLLHKDEVIDFIMVNGKFNVKKYRVITDGIDGNKYVSDHYPIYADIAFKA